MPLDNSTGYLPLSNLTLLVLATQLHSRSLDFISCEVPAGVVSGAERAQ